MENKQPFFSIVIPTWNRGDMIGKTLLSVLSQTHTNFEVIVVDDGSTDNTKDVVESFSDERLRYIWQQNAERAAARNNGTLHATGQYITFLDSDDLFKPEHLSIVYKHLESLSFPPFFHQSFHIEDINGFIETRHENMFKNPLKQLIKKGNFFGSVGLFLHKDIAVENLFDEERVLAGSEDYEMLLRLTMKYPILCGAEMTTRVINHEGRGEIKINKDKLIARVEFLIKKTLSNKDFTQKYNNWLPAFKASNYSFVSLHLALHDEKKLAFKFLRKAVYAYPFSIFNKRFFVIIREFVF
ncbi:MAG: hypothetical protein CVU11_00785 [Bacteroidetes bacterium HGW-Bacteroidetes-6]|jgi:glycosyltransferase involved in cell wall biosynthesis|nr:MAG: hypothetical protein CVU11_00785 [Bacteroidetes bacterium HGW-Bacteroidetes-6]